MNDFTKRALFGGILFLCIIGTGSFVSGYEAKQLIKVSINGLNTL